VAVVCNQQNDDYSDVAFSQSGKRELPQGRKHLLRVVAALTRIDNIIKLRLRQGINDQAPV